MTEEKQVTSQRHITDVVGAAIKSTAVLYIKVTYDGKLMMEIDGVDIQRSWPQREIVQGRFKVFDP